MPIDFGPAPDTTPVVKILGNWPWEYPPLAMFEPHKEMVMFMYGRTLEQLSDHRGLTAKEALHLLRTNEFMPEDHAINATLIEDIRQFKIASSFGKINRSSPNPDSTVLFQTYPQLTPFPMDTMASTLSVGIPTSANDLTEMMEVAAGPEYALAELRVAVIGETGEEVLQQRYATPLMGGALRKSWRDIPRVYIELTKDRYEHGKPIP